MPTALLIETADALARPGERAVLGPSTDGGYYLLGLKTPHRRLFEEITWSTERVAAQTLERARELKLDVHMLPAWYDVDDVEGLRRLHGELGSARAGQAKLDPHTPLLPRRNRRFDAQPGGRRIDRRSARKRSTNSSWERLMVAAKAKSSVDPRRYFEGVRTDSDRPAHDPVCLYLETTNRCNLLCTTCPRTYEELEPPADMSWQLFCSIVDQIPNLSRAVLHGVGEPMLVKNLPRMVRYLKDRGTYVLFNTNGTVLNEKNGRALIEAELDELRVSFDAANAESYKAIRGKNYFNRILKNVRAFRDLQEREGHSKPRVSAWLTGMRETVEQLPDFVRVAAETGVKEVYLQRLVFFEENAIGKARPDQALYEQLSREEASHIDRAADIAASLGITFSASGAASEPGMSFEAQRQWLPVVAVPPAVDRHVHHC